MSFEGQVLNRVFTDKASGRDTARHGSPNCCGSQEIRRQWWFTAGTGWSSASMIQAQDKIDRYIPGIKASFTPGSSCRHQRPWIWVAERGGTRSCFSAANHSSVPRKGESSMESTSGLPGLEMSPILPFVPATTSLSRVDVIIHSPNELSLLLDQAVQQLIPVALESRQGILVTQISQDTYSVEVHETVLCGVIQEKRIDSEKR